MADDAAALAPAIPRLAGLAAQLLGWTPPVFWAATPSELALSLAPTTPIAIAAPPSRAEIARLIERDTHG